MVVLIYIIYFTFKLALINKINKKIEEYKNWSNYYAKIEFFENAKQIRNTEIWYKDNKYKISVEYFDKDGKNNTITRYLNLDDKKRIDLENGEIKEHNIEYVMDIFNDGKYILEFYPWFNDFQYNKIRICLMNIVTINKENEGIKIKNGKKILYLNKDWTTPISYSDSENEKITFISFNIKSNSVKDNDLEIKKDL